MIVNIFFCGLFQEALSIESVQRRVVGKQMNDELEEIRRDEDVA